MLTKMRRKRVEWPEVKQKEGELPWVTYAKDLIYKKNNCLNLAVVGGPGSGKSWGLLSFFHKLDPDFDVNEQVFFKAKELLRYFEQKKVVKGKPVAFDEAGIDASNLKWQDEINIGLSAFFQTSRYLNYYFGMTVPYLSYVSKGVRKLMNCRFTARGWTRDGYTKMLPRSMEFNDEMDKFYFKRLLKTKPNGLRCFTNKMLLPKPADNIVREYEKKKAEFTAGLYAKLRKRIEAKELKEEMKSKLNMTYNQDYVLTRLKAGALKHTIANELKCTEDNIARIMISLKNKGIEILPEYDRNKHVIRYIVRGAGF